MTSVLDKFNEATHELLASLKVWASDPYAADFRYIGHLNTSGDMELLTGELVLYPLPVDGISSFQVEAEGLIAGQYIQNDLTPEAIINIVDSAVRGDIAVGNLTLSLRKHALLSAKRDRTNQEWAIRPTVMISGNQPTSLPEATALSAIDQALRMGDIPFDGLDELVRWLAVLDPREHRSKGSLRVVLNAPCNIAFAESGFKDEVFTITIDAHPGTRTDMVGVAVVGHPGPTQASRHQVGSNIEWDLIQEGRLRRGKATVKLPLAERALVVLSVGNACVQRQWFPHPAKSQNERLLAMRTFDRDLKQVRFNLLEGTQPEKFELAVAALAFLRGFAPSVQLETDSPDIVLTTPGGQMVLIECTLQSKDVHNKVGKLVDRRHALEAALSTSRSARPILAVLVTRQHRQQVAMTTDEFRDRKIALVTRDQLEEYIHFAGNSTDPDTTVSKALAAFATHGSSDASLI
ncbi:hypothetical protein [Luteibacter sp. 9135]|uniref:hypothetical protein n=1 Tax=Luteibacter sp. 9135 TaxID=1500893 RepID=UPI000560BDFA|nr:hypothetical protein [Luteibacter sp. 9135]